MSHRIPALGLTLSALGCVALAAVPGHHHGSAALAAAGSDVPAWGIVVIALVVVIGLIFVVLGMRGRGQSADEATAAPRHDAGPTSEGAETGAATAATRPASQSAADPDEPHDDAHDAE